MTTFFHKSPLTVTELSDYITRRKINKNLIFEWVKKKDCTLSRIRIDFLCHLLKWISISIKYSAVLYKILSTVWIFLIKVLIYLEFKLKTSKVTNHNDCFNNKVRLSLETLWWKGSQANPAVKQISTKHYPLPWTSSLESSLSTVISPAFL